MIKHISHLIIKYDIWTIPHFRYFLFSSHQSSLIPLILFLLISLVIRLKSWFCFMICSSALFFLTLFHPTIKTISLYLQMNQFLSITFFFPLLFFSNYLSLPNTILLFMLFSIFFLLAMTIFDSFWLLILYFILCTIKPF